MFNSPVGMRSGPTAGQAAAAAGLPHAEVPGDLRNRVEQVLLDEPEHPEPSVSWPRHADESDRQFGLRRFLRPHRYRLAVAFALVAVETVAIQLGPVLTQIGVDDGILAGNRSVLVAAAVAYAGLLVVATALGAVRTAFTGRLGERLMERLRIRTFAHMQRQGMDFYTDEKAGVLLTRMTSDIEALSVLFQEGIVNFAVQALTLVVITGLLFNYDPLLAIVTLAAAVPPTVGGLDVVPAPGRGPTTAPCETGSANSSATSRSPWPESGSSRPTTAATPASPSTAMSSSATATPTFGPPGPTRSTGRAARPSASPPRPCSSGWAER